MGNTLWDITTTLEDRAEIVAESDYMDAAIKAGDYRCRYEHFENEVTNVFLDDIVREENSRFRMSFSARIKFKCRIIAPNSDVAIAKLKTEYKKSGKNCSENAAVISLSLAAIKTEDTRTRIVD